jgi:hypothetical protein
MQRMSNFQDQVQYQQIQENNQFQQQQYFTQNIPSNAATMLNNVISPYLKSVSQDEPEAQLVSPFISGLMNASCNENNVSSSQPFPQETSTTSTLNMGLAAIPIPLCLSSPFNNSVAPAPINSTPTPINSDTTSKSQTERTITTVLPPNILPGQKI